jgi:hypothetical protein
MKKNLTKTEPVKKRGRPAVNKNPEDVIQSNGLTLRQWKRIQQECGSSTTTATEKLRNIVDWYFTQLDSELVNEKLETAARLDRVSKEKKM